MLTDLNKWQVAPALHWSEAFALWLKQTPTKKRTERSGLTLSAYLSDVRLFATWFEQVNGCVFDPALLTVANTTPYFNDLRDAGVPSTYNRKLASVQMLVTWARGEGLLDADPCAWIPRMETMRESPRDIPADEWALLELVAEGGEHLKRGGEFYRLRDLVLFRLMGNAGLRIHEAVGLRLDDLHLEQGYIHVVGKGQKHRKVKVKSGKLVEAIKAWQAIKPESLEGTLVTEQNGDAISRFTAGERFAMIAQTAGVQATPHALRHTFIYRLIDACMAKGMHWAAALKTVCLQTGDTPDVILDYYTGARESDIFAVMEVL